jgi:ubiquinol-cytochrome c reductase iron-sulfur subunit
MSDTTSPVPGVNIEPPVSPPPGAPDVVETNRRDFLIITTAAVAGIGTASAIWPFIDTMNPAADTLALASTEVDLSPIQQGQRITVTWRGKPVFIDYRTQQEIDAARNVKVDELPDPEPDEKRAIKPEYLIVVGICTHLGCVPLGQKATDPRGDFGGWFCPCHGSQYDTAGRIRRGPAPANLHVPAYTYIGDKHVRIG